MKILIAGLLSGTVLVSGVCAEEAKEDIAPAVADVLDQPDSTDQAGASQSQRYVVVKGDTLWDIAQLFYTDSFAWPRIHALNKEAVKDPNLIYPQQTLVLPGAIRKPAMPGARATLATPTVPVETVQQAARAEQPPVKPEAVSSAEEAARQVEEDMPEVETEASVPAVAVAAAPARRSAVPKTEFVNYDGKITSSRDENRVMFSQGDLVFVNLGAKDGLVAGDLLQIVRKNRKIYDAKAKKIQWVIQELGKIRVTSEIYNTRAECEILFSHDPVNIGDGVVKISAAEMADQGN